MPKDELAEFGRRTRESIKTSGAIRLANDLLDVYKEAMEVYKKKNKKRSGNSKFFEKYNDRIQAIQDSETNREKRIKEIEKNSKVDNKKEKTGKKNKENEKNSKNKGKKHIRW